MRLGMSVGYAGGIREAVDQVVELEKAGMDVVWVAEAYGVDAVSVMGYIAARTERIEIASGILPIYSRTPALIAMPAAGLDMLSQGRFILGLGASGPQVIEGFHGVPYDKPLGRTREIIEIIRMGLLREALVSDGIFKLPLPPDQGLGLGKPLKLLNKPERPAVPLWVAALGDKNVAMTAEVADGWLPFLFFPEKSQQVWGEAIARGTAKR